MQALSAAGYHTARLFHQVQSLGRHHETARGEKWPSAQLAAEADRFELWAVNLGLFASGHASLDYRVRDTESIQQTLLRFLSSLNEALNEVLEYFGGAFPSANKAPDEASDSERGDFDVDFSDDGFASEGVSDADLLLDSIRDPINRLFKMGIWIRNPTSRFTSPKALGYAVINTETGVDLLEVFKSYDYDYISSLFLEYRKVKALEDNIPVTEPAVPDTKTALHDETEHVWEPIRTVLAQHAHERSDGTEPFLVRRIAGANTRRRQLIAYWKVHRDKLDQQAAWNLRMLRPQLQGGTPSLSAIETAPQAPTNSGASNLDDFGGLAAPQSVTTASQLDFSRLAVRDDGQSDMSVSEYAASTWRPGKEVLGFPPPPAHPAGTQAFQCPYCSTLCSGALLRERAWGAHLIHDLRPYICTHEHCRNPDQLYDSVEDWTKHESSAHGPDDSQRIHCPVCLANSFEDSAELTTHLARHLERFSLFSLPRSVGEDDGSERTSQRSAGAFSNNSRDDAGFADEMGGNGSGSSASAAATDPEEKEPIRWIKCMKRFRDMLTSAAPAVGDRKAIDPFDIEEPIRVAVIDDGVDVLDPQVDNLRVIGGRSYGTEDSSGLSAPPYFTSSSGHGTAMAKQIHFMCPYAQLYVLKLDQVANGNGTWFTAKSAAQAIETAVHENVHIISMSWALQPPENEAVLRHLEFAIKAAEEANILMFCSAADMGFRSNWPNRPFPVRAPHHIFSIGAAGLFGNRDGWDAREQTVDFTLPGQNIDANDLSALTSPRFSGSSVSAALAAGLCALMLYCVQNEMRI
ncbi:hypothetical protein OQA88_2698 [Cercophora sp. LCS_1]